MNSGAQIKNENPIRGLVSRGLLHAGAPVAGTSAVQTITLAAFAACVLRLGFMGHFANVVFDGNEDNTAIDAAVTDALEGLPSVGTDNVTVAVTGTTDRAIAVTFAGDLSKFAVPLITAVASGEGAPTATVAETTAGVTATGRGAGVGSKLRDTTSGIDYINTGKVLAPVWTKVGTQT